MIFLLLIVIWEVFLTGHWIKVLQLLFLPECPIVMERCEGIDESQRLYPIVYLILWYKKNWNVSFRSLFFRRWRQPKHRPAYRKRRKKQSWKKSWWPNSRQISGKPKKSLLSRRHSECARWAESVNSYIEPYVGGPSFRPQACRCSTVIRGARGFL